MDRIVVGIDGSAAAAAALHWAVEEAKLRKAKLEVLHAWELPPLAVAPFAASSIDPAALEDAATRLVLATLADEDTEGVSVEPTIVGGPAALSLLERAKSAGLLVVGQRGAGGFIGLLLGSVSQQVVQHAPCPVVVVPSASPPSGGES